MRDFSEPLQRRNGAHTERGKGVLVRALTGFVVVLVLVSLLTQQYWLLPAGLAILGAGVLLTSR